MTKKNLTQRLAEQDKWKSRNNLKTTNFVEFKNDKNVIFLTPSKMPRMYLFHKYDWRKANWMDPDDYNAKELK
tara:strand:+ start:2853 stop:3071 length:219 start_codon:yes stop_codon:yes gene_type:complete